MTGFLLTRVANGLLYSWVSLEPWCVLPQAMLYTGCLCVPGVACMVCLGTKMVDATETLSKCAHYPGQMAQDRACTQRARRAAQALGTGRSLAGCVLSYVKLGITLCTGSVWSVQE